MHLYVSSLHPSSPIHWCKFPSSSLSSLCVRFTMQCCSNGWTVGKLSTWSSPVQNHHDSLCSVGLYSRTLPMSLYSFLSVQLHPHSSLDYNCGENRILQVETLAACYDIIARWPIAAGQYGIWFGRPLRDCGRADVTGNTHWAVTILQVLTSKTF